MRMICMRPRKTKGRKNSIASYDEDPPLNWNWTNQTLYNAVTLKTKKISGRQQLYRSIVLFEEKFTNVHTIHTSCHTIKLRFILEHWRKKENETNTNIHQTLLLYYNLSKCSHDSLSDYLGRYRLPSFPRTLLQFRLSMEPMEPFLSSHT